ncbi:MAG: homoserine O-acetyltransferase [Candidatus Nanopelagicales bacterium]|nr:homoserine O-acetyltransferase [Candidatus Nanopelagicales bacterium]
MGNRQFLDVGSLDLQSGGHLPAIRVAYETWGSLNADGSNAVYVCHALTGDSHVTGSAGSGHLIGGWWDQLVGPGAPLDTDEWFVVCANVLGGCQGTTGPMSLAPDGRAWGSRFPVVTVADMVEVEVRLADALGIPSWALILGPSLGGMRVLEWMVGHRQRVRAGLLLGTTAAVSGDQIGTHHTQIAAIESDPAFRGGDYYDAPDGDGPHRGLGIARRIAHLTYRTESELDLRFGRAHQTEEHPINGGRYAVESYLDHHADKLSRRFDANTYITLTRAMSLFDLGEGRGGTQSALATIDQPLIVVGIDTDRLFPLRQQRIIAEQAPGALDLRILSSPYGHDGFLVEDEQVGAFIGEALRASRVG